MVVTNGDTYIKGTDIELLMLYLYICIFAKRPFYFTGSLYEDTSSDSLVYV